MIDDKKIKIRSDILEEIIRIKHCYKLYDNYINLQIINSCDVYLILEIQTDMFDDIERCFRYHISEIDDVLDSLIDILEETKTPLLFQLIREQKLKRII